MTEPTAKHQQEAREIAEEYKQRIPQLWKGEVVPCRPWLEMRLTIAFTSRDSEIREVLEGLASKHYVSLSEYCWCRAPGTATKPAGDYHGDACLAARGLWERVQVSVKKEKSDVVK